MLSPKLCNSFGGGLEQPCLMCGKHARSRFLEQPCCMACIFMFPGINTKFLFSMTHQLGLVRYSGLLQRTAQILYNDLRLYIQADEDDELRVMVRSVRKAGKKVNSRRQIDADAIQTGTVDDSFPPAVTLFYTDAFFSLAVALSLGYF